MSRTSQSIRRRCLALAAIAAGVNWLATGQALADGGTGDPIGAVLDATRQADHVGLPGLSSADGVLSVADAAGSAAGQGLRSLPGLTKAGAAESTANDAAGSAADKATGTATDKAIDTATTKATEKVAQVGAARTAPAVPGLPDATKLAITPELPDSSALRGTPGRLIRTDVPDAAAAVAPKAGEIAGEVGELTADLPKAPNLPDPARDLDTQGLPEVPAQELPDVPGTENVKEMAKDLSETAGLKHPAHREEPGRN